jgi:hypothetical protein
MPAKQPQLDLLRSYSMEFEAQLRRINSFTNHRVSIGSAHEGILRRFLQQHLPKRFGVGEGFVVDNKGNASGQCDIIIWSVLDYSPIYSDGDFVIVPAESVKAIIEVKTSLNKKSLVEAFKQLKPIHEMNEDIYTSIFGFEAVDLGKCFEHIVYDLETDVAKTVDSICALKGWALQRFGLEPDDTPGIGTLGRPHRLKNDSGEPLTGRFVPIFPPRDDRGFDLVFFLGFLFGALAIPDKSVTDLIINSTVIVETPIIPGAGRNLTGDEIVRFRSSFSDFVRDVQIKQMMRFPCPVCKKPITDEHVQEGAVNGAIYIGHGKLAHEQCWISAGHNINRKTKEA